MDPCPQVIGSGFIYKKINAIGKQNAIATFVRSKVDVVCFLKEKEKNKP
jgi:hypothetical protein